MKRYKEYKDSGVKWIGEVPRHWEVRKVKFLSDYVTDTSNNPHKIGLENIEGFSGKFIDSDSTFDGNGADVKIGDIVYGKLRPYLCKSWVATFDCNAVGDFCVFRSHPDAIDNHFMNYIFLSNEFTGICNASTYGAKMPRVSPSFILGLQIPIPPLSEQRSIVAFLDGKCRKIDLCVESKSKEIELLRELKQAVIAAAVTRGINPDATLKHSNMPWIGEIPDGWRKCRIKNLISLSSGYSLISLEIDDGIYPVYGANGIRGYYSKYNFEGDRILIGRVGALCGNIHYSNEKIWATEHALVSTLSYRCQIEFEYRWLAYTLEAMNLNQYGIGSAQPVLSASFVENQFIPVPPLEEQKAIANYIDTKCTQIEAAIAHLQAEIEHFKAYKQRLISDAVTGQICLSC